MYSYQELGLVNTKEMFCKAYQEHYAVPALNFVTIEQLNGMVDAVIERKSPIILLVSPNLHCQLGMEMTARLVQAVTDRIRETGMEIPVALHLDHGMSYEQCVAAIKGGFSSVMIDGSKLPFEDNIVLTQKVVEYAHKHNVTVEAELGILKGAEEAEEGAAKSMYTDPDMAVEFIDRSGCDSLAISIGTCHGLVKMVPRDNGTLPELRYDILQQISEKKPGFPIVLHGCSNISKRHVDMINEHGGYIKKTVGIPDEQVRKASKMAVCKVNIATDGWICGLANTRRILDEEPGAIDSRCFTLKIRPLMKELYLHKIEIMGSSDRA